MAETVRPDEVPEKGAMRWIRRTGEVLLEYWDPVLAGVAGIAIFVLSVSNVADSVVATQATLALLSALALILVRERRMRTALRTSVDNAQGDLRRLVEEAGKSTGALSKLEARLEALQSDRPYHVEHVELELDLKRRDAATVTQASFVACAQSSSRGSAVLPAA